MMTKEEAIKKWKNRGKPEHWAAILRRCMKAEKEGYHIVVTSEELIEALLGDEK